jgi:hypothetical protein
MKKASLKSAFAVLLIVVVSILPVYAQGPLHTGAPDIHEHLRDEPGGPWTVAYCDGYDVVATWVANAERRVWLNEDGSNMFQLWNLREHVTLTNTSSGTSVGVEIRLVAEYNYDANTTTISGIRSAIVRPDGGLEELSNVGHLVISGISIMEGDVLSAAGKWATVTELVFDHFAWPCEVVAD